MSLFDCVVLEDDNTKANDVLHFEPHLSNFILVFTGNIIPFLNTKLW